MRDLTFRAWERELQEMIPVYSLDFRAQIVNSGFVWRTFDEVVLMQFTGCKDKDGTPIFEDDVVKGYWYVGGVSHRFIGVVRFIAPNFEVEGVKQYIGCRYPITSALKVLGSAYEHPHLLDDAGMSMV